MKIKKFEELSIWKLSLKITKLIYDISSKDKFSKDFSLRDQIRRAVIFISSNIVEDFEKNNNNEFIRYLKIAKDSVGEVRNQLFISKKINSISLEDFNNLNNLLIDLANQIGSFISYLNKTRTLSKLAKLAK